MSRSFTALVVLAALAVLGLVIAAENKTEKMETADKAPEQPAGKVAMSEDEWRRILTPEQFRVLRKAGTEPAGGEVYRQFKKQGKGTYFCAGCGAELFTAKQKFDSGCGWPSFYDPSKAQNVVTKRDISLGMVRIEVICARCNGHLGHVFEGEGFDTPTDKRYCINGVALKFVPEEE